jgi:uroporphyrinogen decarboxylase
MTSKERVLAAINHEEPDKVPLDSWLAPEIGEMMREALNVDISTDRFGLSKKLGHDILYGNIGFCDGYNSIYIDERKIGDNLFQDRFGIQWRRKDHEFGCYCEFAEYPLADMKNYDRFSWPDPIESSRDGLEMYKKLIEQDGREYAILGGVACTMLEGAWYLRGLDNFMMDLVQNRDFAEELLDGAMQFSLAISKRLVEMGVDIIWWGDDVGVETGPMISPALFRALIIPRYAHMVEEVKKINNEIKIAFHTDGSIEWALDDLVDVGFDILNPLQPDANDVKAVKKRYGKRLSFWGNVDTRNVMSSGTVQDVISEVRQVIDTLGHGGGLILCSNHTIQATARAFENTVAYYWAANHFRDYPLRTRSTSTASKVQWVS